MARVLRLPRYAAILAGIPLAMVFAAACGGSDVVDQTDGSAGDAHPPDGGMADSQGGDGTMPDGASQDADATALDSSQPEADTGATDSGAKDAEVPDTEAPDADAASVGADADAAVTDADAAGLLDADGAALADTGPDADASLASDATLDATPDSGQDATDAASDAPLEADADASGFDSGTGGLMQSLFTATPFVVLGGATVTNSGVSTVLIGDVGTTGPSITGLTGPPFQPSGTTDVNNAVATQAVLDLGTAYTSLTGQACPPANHLTGMDLGGMTLAPGVYCFTSSAGQIASTTLTFDAKGDPERGVDHPGRERAHDHEQRDGDRHRWPAVPGVPHLLDDRDRRDHQRRLALPRKHRGELANEPADERDAVAWPGLRNHGRSHAAEQHHHRGGLPVMLRRAEPCSGREP